MKLPMVLGRENPKIINLLFKLLPKMSANTKMALKAHFIDGYSARWIFEIYGIESSNFTRAINTLQAVNNINEEIIELKRVT
jgi:Gpi18-like mannosyltransferase